MGNLKSRLERLEKLVIQDRPQPATLIEKYDDGICRILGGGVYPSVEDARRAAPLGKIFTLNTFTTYKEYLERTRRLEGKTGEEIWETLEAEKRRLEDHLLGKRF
jgi:hypothetical protein